MIFNMTRTADHDYIQNYERSLAGLQLNPEDRNLQHQLVLSLARCGALDFAIAEYNRFGLSDVRHHEDIMALGGRLSKDLYLRSDGQAALEHARNAAQKYEAAFKDSHGFYSGINAATMALMANMPADIISARVTDILGHLPDPESLSPTEHYFVQATRAECFLMSGDIIQAKAVLRSAIQFDPMNYAAHASTIKQFEMICRKRKDECGWLVEFNPPRPAHYAGHIHLSLSDPELDALKTSAIDHIQKHDIGFGFGALAAGSDIIIAEALLAEGAELHLILPCPPDDFFNHSVAPFGSDWPKRYQACLDAALSLRILSKAESPDPQLTRTSSQFAMGQAILMGQHLTVSPAQLLIWDEQKQSSYTAVHADDWSQTKEQQINISLRHRADAPTLKDQPDLCRFLLSRSDASEPESYATALAALHAAVNLRNEAGNVKCALHIDVDGENANAVLSSILVRAAPQGILLSDAFASLLAVSEIAHFEMKFAGLIDVDDNEHIRCYAINA